MSEDSSTPPPSPGPHTAGDGRWQPPEPWDLEQKLPQFSVLEVLGVGGMGAVYKAFQPSLERYVAIKILSPGLTDEDVQFAERFKQEAKTMARLSHPGIVSVHDFGETADGLYYIVMEFVEGTDVQRMLAGQGRLEPEHALAVALHVCDALAYAHRNGIIHRDIKPANVMVDKEGRVKVADFGLAKGVEPGSSLVTGTGKAMGTPDFVAPEALITGMTVDQRADLYAVGVMLYQMLTGNVPRGRFEHPSVKVPGLDPRYDAVVDRAMQEDREARYACAEDLCADLTVIHTAPLPQRLPPPAQTPPRTQPPHLRPAAGSTPPKVWPAPALIGIGAIVVTALVLINAGKLDDAVHVKAVGEDIAGARTTASVAKAVLSGSERGYTNTLGMKFVPVPGTHALFCIHETRRRDYAAYAAVNPEVDGDWKDPRRDNLPVGGGGDDDPAVFINWDDAVAFCAWLSKQEGHTYRLPTDREWSFAVGIGARESAGASPKALSEKIKGEYPWGQQWPPPKGSGNFADSMTREKFSIQVMIAGHNDGYAGLAPVMSFKPNKLGLYDLAGNAWEWCEDWMDEERINRVQRGGSWGSANPLSSFRNPQSPGRRTGDFGFRCVMEPDK